MLIVNLRSGVLKIGMGLLLLMQVCEACGQNLQGGLLKKCPVNTINYEQGLINNEVTDIITDSLGFTWVSTVIGIQRFNGYALETINPIVGRDTIKIKSRARFFGLRDGRLWISCRQGVIEYNPSTNLFKKLIAVAAPGDNYYSVIPIKETSEGVWCIQQNKGLVVYSRSGVLTRSDGILAAQSVNRLFGRYEWVSTANDEFIFIRDEGHRRVLQISMLTHRLEAVRDFDADIVDFCCNSHYFYINTVNGLYRYDIGSWKFLNSCSFKGYNHNALWFSHCYLVNENRVLVGINTMLLEYNADFSSCKVFTMLDGGPILPAGGIQRIYFDQFERIWLIDNDDIRRIQDRDVPFTTLRYPGASNNFVRSLYYDSDRKLLLAGCLNGGLLLYDERGAPVWTTPLMTDKVKDVLAIDKLDKQNYLVDAWRKGWYLLNIDKRTLTPIAIPGIDPKMLTDNLFTSTVQRLNDSVIFASGATCVFKCTFAGSKLEHVSAAMSVLTDGDEVSSFRSLKSGDLWAGSINGNVFCTTNHVTRKIARLPFMIRSMTEDDFQHIWIGTISGLYVFGPDGHLLATFIKSSGLLNDCIYSMLPVKKQAAVFAGTNLGLAHIDLHAGIKNYTRELGLQDNEFNTDAVVKTTGGRFYFGGVNGISVFTPETLTQLVRKPILNVTKLVVNDSSFNSSAGIWKGDTITLRYDQNHLQLDFAAMGLLNADKYLYRYRLTGFEKKWQSTYQPTGVRYTLSQGTYQMEISCSNPLSRQALMKTLTIIVLPPWWLTWWFITLLIVLILASLVWAVSSFNKRKYKKELDALQLKQTLQTERERISRDLHDNLGAQANAIFYGTEQLKKQNGHSLGLVSDLHDTAGDMLTVLRETLWAMRITQVGAAELWLRILNFAKKLGPYYPQLKIEISGMPPAGILINASTALNLILIVQEAINNAIRHAEASVITISSYTGENNWQIEIADDGKGFDMQQVNRKSESYGIENMNERAGEAKIGFVINSVMEHGTKVSLEIDIRKIESQASA